MQQFYFYLLYIVIIVCDSSSKGGGSGCGLCGFAVRLFNEAVAVATATKEV